MTSNKSSTPWRCGADASVSVPSEVYEALLSAADSAAAQGSIVDIWDRAVHDARSTSIVA